MNLDRFPVNKGDKLFDIDLRGVVTVQAVNPDAVICQAIQNGRKVTLTYNSSGAYVGQRHRVLYWQNPLVIIPSKDTVNWSAQCKVLKATLRAMESYAQVVNSTLMDEDLESPEISSVLTMHERGLLNENDVKVLLDELKNRTN